MLGEVIGKGVMAPFLAQRGRGPFSCHRLCSQIRWHGKCSQDIVLLLPVVYR